MTQFCIIFCQLLQFFSKTEFYQAVERTPNIMLGALPPGVSYWLCSPSSWAEPIYPEKLPEDSEATRVN